MKSPLLALVVLLLLLITTFITATTHRNKHSHRNSQQQHTKKWNHRHSHASSLNDNDMTARAAPDTPCSKTLDIVDDQELNDAVARARQRFLATRPHQFDRLTATVLLPIDQKAPRGKKSLASAEGNGQEVTNRWRRGSYDQNRLAYPASCVKLTYMVSAVQWCLSQQMKFNCLDQHVRPMIMVSSNLETGVVVDYVSGAPNLAHHQTADSTFYQWLSKRNYTQDWMMRRGLLEEQVVWHKTYPTNSGVLLGAEGLAREMFGGNLMNTKCTASLMAEIVSGQLFPEARQYFLDMLYHPLDNGYTTYGKGLPPGSVIYTKVGNAYDTIEEVAYVLLPNGKRFVISTFTNGYEPTEPNFDTLSHFIELVIEEAKLDEGLPPKYVFDVTDSNFFTSGQWSVGQARDMYGSQFKYTTAAGSSGGWKFKLPEEGLYEVSIWSPESSSASTSVPITIQHASGTDTYNRSQRVNGGRWTRLDNHYFFAGVDYAVTLKSNSAGSTVSLNAIKITKFPTCGGIPGSPCPLTP